MSLNSVETLSIINTVSNLEQRANSLAAKLQGSLISSLRIKDGSITNAKIADLAITTAKIEDATIGAAKIASLSANKITAGTVSADRIEADSITADKLNVSALSAISANLGTVTAGSVTGATITGSYFKTSDTNDRIELNYSQLLQFYGGNVVAQFEINQCVIYDGGIFLADSSQNTRGIIGQSGGNVVIGTTTCPLILFQSLNTDYPIIAVGDNDYRVDFVCGTFQIRGTTKTAIVPTKDGFNALYCVESPDVWFFDIANSFDEIDPMFFEVTEGEYHTITNSNNEVIIFRKRKGFAKIRFEEKTKNQFLLNNKLWGQQYE